MINNKLSDDIDSILDQYFKDLAGQNPGNLYDLILTTVEKPLLLYVIIMQRGIKAKQQKSLGLIEILLEKN